MSVLVVCGVVFNLPNGFDRIPSGQYKLDNGQFSDTVILRADGTFTHLYKSQRNIHSHFGKWFQYSQTITLEPFILYFDVHTELELADPTVYPLDFGLIYEGRKLMFVENNKLVYTRAY